MNSCYRDCNPLVSIVMPVFNVESYLDEALDSIKNQTIHDYEIIAINDGSTDGSLGVLKKWKSIFGDRLLIINQKNQGVSAARNVGIELSRGRYIYFFDPDDCIHPNLLKHSITCFNSKPVDIVRFKLVMNKKRMSDKGLFHYYKDSDSFFKEHLNMACHLCIIVFKSEFVKKNKLKFTRDLLYEDMEFVPLALWKANGIIQLDQSLYFYRQHPSSITHKHCDSDKYIQSGKYLLNKLSEYQSETTSIYFKKVISNLKVTAIELISPDDLRWILKMYKDDSCWTNLELFRKQVYYSARYIYHKLKKFFN